MNEYEQIHWVNGIFEDGEWVHWDLIENEEGWDFDEMSRPINLKENPSKLELWELLDDLIQTAKSYLITTGRHLPIYGELGELFGEIKYDIKRHKPGVPGSDGKVGNDFVEVKTISPHKSHNTVSVKRAGNFNKLLIVKITEDFKFKSKMIERKELKKGTGKYIKASWKGLTST